jgi:hypothetical protein
MVGEISLISSDWFSYTYPMKQLVGIIAAICLLGITGNAWSQDTENHWARYEPRTLQSIIDTHQDFTKKLDSDKKAMLLTGDNFPSQVKLTYLGDTRPLPAEQKELLDGWRKAFKKDVLEDVFTTQVRFSEGSREYWILVQKPLLVALPKEVPKGQPLITYMMWIGAIKVGKHWEWLFAMNEFDALENPSLAPER